MAILTTIWFSLIVIMGVVSEFILGLNLIYKLLGGNTNQHESDASTMFKSMGILILMHINIFTTLLLLSFVRWMSQTNMGIVLFGGLVWCLLCIAYYFVIVFTIRHHLLNWIKHQF